ncbi:MAG: hypothetical protein AAGD33_19440 [Actinomycetota bacterium]
MNDRPDRSDWADRYRRAVSAEQDRVSSPATDPHDRYWRGRARAQAIVLAGGLIVIGVLLARTGVWYLAVIGGVLAVSVAVAAIDIARSTWRRRRRTY